MVANRESAALAGVLTRSHGDPPRTVRPHATRATATAYRVVVNKPEDTKEATQ